PTADEENEDRVADPRVQRGEDEIRLEAEAFAEDRSGNRGRGDAEGQGPEEVRDVDVGRGVESPRHPRRGSPRPPDVPGDRVLDVRQDSSGAALVDEVAEGPCERLDGEAHQP